MRESNQPPMKQGSPDDFQTPKIALKPLIPFLKKEWRIWECAEGNGNLKIELRKRGFSCFGTDIIQNQELDFLKHKPVNFDCIITNPPYSLKEKFLDRKSL